MQKRKLKLIFHYITAFTMTALTFASMLLLREVVIMKYCPDAPLDMYGKIQGGIEAILGAVVIYLIFTFIVIRFTPQDMYD